jgi:hypothetical protein
MLFRLMGASVIVGTIVVMSPTRQAPPSPAPGGVHPGSLQDGIAEIIREGTPPMLRTPDGVPAAMAAAMVRGALADGSERLLRDFGGPEHRAEPAAADTLKPDDRRPAWRGGAHR